MLAIATIRQRPDDVRAAMTNRGEDPVLIDHILELDQTHRAVVQELESLRARQNQTSKQLSRQKERPPEVLDELRALRERVRELNTQSEAVKAELDALLLQVPEYTRARGPNRPR